MVHCAEERVSGVMNASGPDSPTTMGDVLGACVRAAGSDARLTWVDDATLHTLRVTPWTEMPLWIPAEENAVTECNTSRARAAGFRCRPIDDTVRDTLAFFTAAAGDPVVTARLERGRKMPADLAPEREQEILRAWHATSR
jgi:2'-hydroxyisoflavone reductase